LLYHVINATIALPNATMPRTKRSSTSTNKLVSKKARKGKDGDSKGDNSKLPSNDKKKKKKKDGDTLDPRLTTVKRLVEAQPTEELQSMIFSFLEKTLGTLYFIRKKDSGVRNFRADKDFIPGSLGFKPELTFPDSLKYDEATMNELTGWNEDLLKCKKALAKRVFRQAERNLKAWSDDFKKDTMRKMVEFGDVIAGREKIMHDIKKSSIW